MNKQSSSPKQIGRYTLTREIGRGGMGTVYLALDTQLNREVAIKCFDTVDISTELAQHLKQEAVLLAKLNHSNVIQLYDVIEDKQTLALVMEYADGPTLAGKLREQQPDLVTGLNWLIQISQGLHQAHSAGIIHCDLKLDNIIMVGDTAKISDFGIAQLQRDHLGQSTDSGRSTSVSASYYSASPEQAQGLPVDFRTDVFSLGVLAYQVLTGRHPFGQTNDKQQILQRIVEQPFKFSPSDVQRLPPQLGYLISSMLEKKPEDRPANTDRITAELRYIRDALVNENTGDNPTALIDTITPQVTPRWRTWLPVGLVFTAALIGFLYFQFFIQPPGNVSVAVITPSFTSSKEGFDEAQQQRIVTTVKSALQESLLNLQGVSLNGNRNLSAFDNDIARFAKAVAADYIVKPSVDCDPQRCRIELLKLSANDGSVLQHQNWPAIAASMSDIRATIAARTQALFPEHTARFAQATMSEQAYQRYLDLYLSSGADTDETTRHLNQLEDLQLEAPEFMPLYELYSRLALDLFDRTGEKATLNKLKIVLGRAPNVVREQHTFQRLEFRRLLKAGDLTGANALVDAMKNQATDRILVNDLQATLAYETGDYERAVALERETVTLQPSYSRYYNLAATEFALGNLDQSRRFAEKTLALMPSDEDSLNLIATIELTLGNLDQAESRYRILIEKNPDSYSHINLGITLMLQGRFDEAIDAIVTATEKNPTNPEYQLNLADSYKLAGDYKSASQIYLNIVTMTNSLDSAFIYYLRAQAQAQLGEYTEAIKTLKAAEKIFPPTPESAYAAALVHSLAGNTNAAVVEVENALQGGIGKVWFYLKWFDGLCESTLFVELINDGTDDCRPTIISRSSSE